MAQPCRKPGAFDGGSESYPLARLGPRRVINAGRYPACGTSGEFSRVPSRAWAGAAGSLGGGGARALRSLRRALASRRARTAHGAPRPPKCLPAHLRRGIQHLAFGLPCHGVRTGGPAAHRTGNRGPPTLLPRLRGSATGDDCRASSGGSRAALSSVDDAQASLPTPAGPAGAGTAGRNAPPP
jgi:hypothetical protein